MDTELVIRAQGGDEEAFASLAVAVGDRLHAVSHRILRDIDLAEDATQQALLAIWQDLPSLRDPARFDAWSYRLLVRACYAEGRRSRQWSPNLRVLPADERAGSDALGSVVDRDQLERGFRRLSIDIARWWSCTTTSTCHSKRLPTRSASRSGRSDPDYFTRCVGSARHSTPMPDLQRRGFPMSTDRDTTRLVRSWLEEGVTALPDRVLDTVLDQLPATPQRRSWWPARRFQEMNNFAKLAVAAAAVVVALLVGANLRLAVPVSDPPAKPDPVDYPKPNPVDYPKLEPIAIGSANSGVVSDRPLAAGSHTIQPFVGPGGLCVGQAGCTDAGAEDDSIRFTLTVPDGWAGLEYSIVPSVERYLPPDGAGLLFGRGGWLWTVPQVCGGSGPDFPTGPTISTGTTVAEFVDALVAHPDLDVTSPTDVTLAGYSGKYLELQAPANIAANQDFPAEGECAYYFVWEPGIYAQGPNALWRIWVLDVDGVRVVVRSDSFPGTTPQVQAQLATIVESIEIAP